MEGVSCRERESEVGFGMNVCVGFNRKRKSKQAVVISIFQGLLFVCNSFLVGQVGERSERELHQNTHTR